MHVWSRPQAILCVFLRHRAVCFCVSLHLLFSVPVYNKGRELGTREFMYNILKAFYLSSDVFFMSSHHLDKTGNGMSFVAFALYLWAEQKAYETYEGQLLFTDVAVFCGTATHI